nr:hypothetical protein [Anaerolineae bacterium]
AQHDPMVLFSSHFPVSFSHNCFRIHSFLVYFCGRLLAFDPSGTLLASASWDGTIRLWDIKSNKVQAVSKDVGSWVTDVSFNHDGSLLASGELGGIVRFWDVTSATELLNLDLYPHQPNIMHVAFNPSGTLLVTAYEPLQVTTTSKDANPIQLWGVK